MTARPIALLLALAALALGLGACTGSERPDEELRAGVERLQTLVQRTPVQLPSIPVDIDEEGRVDKIAGFDARDVDRVWEEMTGRPLVGRVRFFNNDEDGRSYVEWFQKANIQHVTLASRPDGLYVLVNGRPMPHVSWSPGSLDNLLELLWMLREDGEGFALLDDEQYRVLADLLPVMQTLNLRIDLRFPRATGPDGRLVERIPLPKSEAFRLEIADTGETARPLQTVDLEVDFRAVEGDLPGQEAWVPAFFEFSTVDLGVLLEPLGVEVPRLELPDEYRRRIEAEDIRSLGLQLGESGVFFSVDDRLLPHLAWNEESLVNLSTVLAQLYPPGEELPEDAAWVPIIRSTAPLYDDFEIALLLRFPTDEAAEAAESGATSGG